MAQQDQVKTFISNEQHEEYALCSEQLSAIETLLSDHNAPVDPLAAQIAAPILEANATRVGNAPPTTGYEYSRLWAVISRAIEQLAPQIDRIVDLVVALAKSPDPTGYMADMYDMKMWWLEFHTGFLVPDRDDQERVSKKQAWINIHTFNAKLASYNVPALDMDVRSGHVFQGALEEAPWEEYYLQEVEDFYDFVGDPNDEDAIAFRDKVVERQSVRRLNYWIPAAAAYIKYDGKGIYQLQKPMYSEEGSDLLWKGQPGFSKERFHFWMERFEWVSKVSALDYDTRVQAREAAKLMREIEASA